MTPFKPIQLKPLKALSITVLLGLTLISCTQTSTKQDPYDEGDIVTWKMNDHLILKAEVGERRRHILLHPPKAEREFYRPQSERYLGQFPIDYQPTRFDKISESEAREMPISKHTGRGYEFNLMLNGSWVQATDNSVNASDGLDHPDQVKVIVNPDYIERNTKERFADLIERKLDVNSAETKNGLTCYQYREVGGESRRCFLESDNLAVSGFNIYMPDLVPELEGYPIRANAKEPIYGGINITWIADRKNLNQAQEIDTAIWRLLDAWNISPIE